MVTKYLSSLDLYLLSVIVFAVFLLMIRDSLLGSDESSAVDYFG
jgi:hypothetical protein